VRAKIELLPTPLGGRFHPVVGGHSYRPNHNFGLAGGDMSTGFIDLPLGQSLLPGDTAEVLIAFWYWSGLEGEIFVGREWRIQEGAKVVGKGTILEVAD
jgi:translation elongation factor EF-Tu-like GTPase